MGWPGHWINTYTTPSLIDSINYSIHCLTKIYLQTNSIPGPFLTKDQRQKAKRQHIFLPSWSLVSLWWGKGVSTPKYVTWECKWPTERPGMSGGSMNYFVSYILWILQLNTGFSHKFHVGFIISELIHTGNIYSTSSCQKGGNGNSKRVWLSPGLPEFMEKSKLSSLGWIPSNLTLFTSWNRSHKLRYL